MRVSTTIHPHSTEGEPEALSPESSYLPKVNAIKGGPGCPEGISWARPQDPSPHPSPGPWPSLCLCNWTLSLPFPCKHAEDVPKPSGCWRERLLGCNSMLKSWVASQPRRTLHQSALFKHTGRRLSGLKQASVVRPLKPVGDQSTNQYESSFLEEVATLPRGLEVIFCCN